MEHSLDCCNRFYSYYLQRFIFRSKCEEFWKIVWKYIYLEYRGSHKKSFFRVPTFDLIFLNGLKYFKLFWILFFFLGKKVVVSEQNASFSRKNKYIILLRTPGPTPLADMSAKLFYFLLMTSSYKLLSYLCVFPNVYNFIGVKLLFKWLCRSVWLSFCLSVCLFVCL